MLKTLYPDLSTFSGPISTHDFFVVGELHGIDQNAHIMRSLIDETLKSTSSVSLAFEWLITEAELASLRAFINGEINLIETPSFFHDSDGRVTPSHIALLQHIRFINEKHSDSVFIHTFDTESRESEVAMAKNLALIREKTGDMPILVETGAIHAGKQQGSMAGILCGHYRVYNAFVEYKTGRVVVEGNLYDVRDSASQRNGPEEAFDSVIVVDSADPALESVPLTISR